MTRLHLVHENKENKRGHWYIAVVEWNHPNGSGWIFDSFPLRNDSDKNKVKLMINEVFGNRNSLEWMEERFSRQTESECGPRSIWAIAVIVSGSNRGKSMEEIGEAIFRLEEKGSKISAYQVRRSVRHLLIDFRNWDDNAELWGPYRRQESGNQMVIE